MCIRDSFIDIGGVSGLLHISEISHDHIDTPHSVFNVNDELKVMIIDLDAERGRISLSTKQLEPEPGDMLKNRDLVFEKADEMAEKYRRKLLAEAEGVPLEEEIPEAVEEPVVEEPVAEEAVAEEAVAEEAVAEEPAAEEAGADETEAVAEVETETVEGTEEQEVAVSQPE